MARHAQRSIAGGTTSASRTCILEALLHQGAVCWSTRIGRRIATAAAFAGPSTGSKRAASSKRSADAGDRRVKKVDLTRSGRALITRIFDKHKAPTSTTPPTA